MILWLYNKNKNKIMIRKLKKSTYNYYRQTNTKKLAEQAKVRRLSRLRAFDY